MNNAFIHWVPSLPPTPALIVGRYRYPDGPRSAMHDPVAATRRVLVLALSQIPAKIHEELVDNKSIYKGMFNKRAEIHFNGVLNDPKNPTNAGDFHSPNVWEWRPADL